MSKGKKICIVVTSLGKGGAERSSALLTQVLHDQGYQIHLVTIVDCVQYEFKGALLNLGAQVKGNSYASKYRKFKLLKQYLKTHDFDFIIDNRARSSFFRELIVSKLLFSPNKTIYIVRSYNLNTYFIKPKRIAKWLYKKASKIVAVSKDIEKKIVSTYAFDNVTTINNPIESITVEEDNKETSKYILFFGRIVDEVKNLSLLVQSYSESQLPEKGIALVIMGDGKDKALIEDKVKALHMDQSVRFIPFDSHPYPRIKQALFTVLTSHYEGFPRSIIESLAMGTPVISVDCKSGPREIIDHEVNGLLVENYNAKALAEAMNRFINTPEIYLNCKKNAKQSVARFSMSEIGNQWEQLLNTIMNERT